MPVHDNLPRGIRDSIDHHIRNLERLSGPVEDTLATLRVLAPPLLIGMEDELRAMANVIDNIKARWGYYMARDEWASTSDVNAHLDRLPRATGRRTAMATTQTDAALEPSEKGDEKKAEQD